MKPRSLYRKLVSNVDSSWKVADCMFLSTHSGKYRYLIFRFRQELAEQLGWKRGDKLDIEVFKRCVVIKKSVEGWTLHRTNTAQEGKVEIKFSGFHGCWFDYPPEPEPLRVLSVKDGKLKVSMPSTVFATR